MSETNMLGKIVSASVAIYVLAYLAVPSLVAFAGVNISALSAAQQAMLAFVGLIVVLLFGLIVLNFAGIKV
jgi:hypothetical protein